MITSNQQLVKNRSSIREPQHPDSESDTIEELQEQARTFLNWSKTQLRERPATALITAAIVGLAAGWFFKWRR